MHTLYRVDKTDLDKIPDEGPAILVCNHVSFVDALVLAGCIRRPIRFVMYFRIFQLPILSFLLRAANSIPIASVKEDRKMLEDAFSLISGALREGELVCIFPEGKITDDGELNVFRPGVMKALGQDPVPVIPLALRGLWGSFFSRAHGNAMSRLFPRGMLSRLELVAGDATEADAVSPELLQQRVAQLRGERR